jgi:hypothetical protein
MPFKSNTAEAQFLARVNKLWKQDEKDGPDGPWYRRDAPGRLQGSFSTKAEAIQNEISLRATRAPFLIFCLLYIVGAKVNIQ